MRLGGRIVRPGALVGAGMLLASIGLAAAAIPDAGGTYHGCYDTTSGALRVIDRDAGHVCGANERLISWNKQGQTGPAGPKGPTGPKGLTGPTGPRGASGGIASTHAFGGFIASIAGDGTSAVWRFAGGTRTVPVTSGQSVLVTGTVALGLQPTDNGTTSVTSVDVHTCFRPSTSTTAPVLMDSNYLTVHLQEGVRESITTSTARAGFAGGDYQVGACVRNQGTLAISDNDYSVGSILVVG